MRFRSLSLSRANQAQPGRGAESTAGLSRAWRSSHPHGKARSCLRRVCWRSRGRAGAGRGWEQGGRHRGSPGTQRGCPATGPAPAAALPHPAPRGPRPAPAPAAPCLPPPAARAAGALPCRAPHTQLVSGLPPPCLPHKGPVSSAGLAGKPMQSLLLRSPCPAQVWFLDCTVALHSPPQPGVAVPQVPCGEPGAAAPGASAPPATSDAPGKSTSSDIQARLSGRNRKEDVFHATFLFPKASRAWWG